MNKYIGLENIINKNKLKYNEKMAKHTTIRIGGEAKCLVLPTEIKEIINVIKYAKENKIKYYVIGNGSDLVVCDEGIDGIVIKISNGFDKVTVKGNVIEAYAGAMMPKVSQIAKNHELSGFEFACGIPGTIGGGIRMNAGAYGSEMSNIVEEITYLDEECNLCTMTKAQAKFGYRQSIFKNNSKLVVISAKFVLQNGNLSEIEDKMKEYTVARKTKQPIEYPNAGSTFKRPEGYFVGKLIQDAGLRGYTVGDVQVSKKHTGFIVNKGNATCKEVKQIIKDIQEIVYEKFGVHLEPEIEFIGGKRHENNT